SDVTSDNRFSDDNTWGGATATFDPGQGPCGCSHADQYLHQEVVNGSTLASAYYGNGNKNRWQRGSGGGDYNRYEDHWSMLKGQDNTVQGHTWGSVSTSTLTADIMQAPRRLATQGHVERCASENHAA
ncbi:MAG: hypothetical protein ACLP9L_15385, partial [Thermoguttaceae bacterium]